MHKQTSHMVTVTGFAWQGFKTSQVKTFHGDKFPQTMAELKPHFGDLESVLDYQIERIETVFERLSETKTRQTATREIVTPFADEDSELLVAELESA